MNLVKLFTKHEAMYVDTDQLARGRKLLTIYTSRGHKLKEVGATREIREKASWGVHRDNLFASQTLADAAYDRIFEAISSRNAAPSEPCRHNGLPA